MSVSNVLNVVRGLGICDERATDEWCLAAFFLGPGNAVLQALEALDENERAQKRLQEEFARISGRRRR